MPVRGACIVAHVARWSLDVAVAVHIAINRLACRVGISLVVNTCADYGDGRSEETRSTKTKVTSWEGTRSCTWGFCLSDAGEKNQGGEVAEKNHHVSFGPKVTI